MKKHKLIYIKWTDAVFSSDAWVSLDTAKDWASLSDWEVESVGWLVDETKEYVVIASKKQAGTEMEMQYGLLLKIPKTWIRERKYL